MLCCFEAYPKINIFLKILQKEGTYHKLISRMCLVKDKLKDTISIKNAPSFSLKGNFDCPIEENSLFKALQALKNFLKQKNFSNSLVKSLDTLAIEAEKNIPTQAGLGGGSADAGGLIYHLNEVFELQLSLEELYSIGSLVGADTNFFISQYQSANATSYGEVIEPFKEDSLTNRIEIYVPNNISCSTKAIYQAYSPKTCFSQTHMWLEKPSLECLNTYHRSELNDLLEPALLTHPTLKNIESELGNEWFFSGSGSAFFRLKRA
ncbi:4-(cytidine 5'-diphospho)-2-C-methyl-D-erythritol kinase [Helicobacter cetorum]|uniref:4-diphosphocytidyl-2-C-methyl-D-erythritol kinase n=1 Tax=Helicobacter cetorum (strain ATCC BAA-540 / CCUG 52418 / MIT 99-5656) TaxID=1163745 RepID=I0EQG9_HELCM|nr:4-(cytidine 5'-diphospho)-2-C-methyl-D-erythritol kinase [Helicobacter cetorum]AFI05188.1 4-diphosphocytidyl-2-C-methyl-D-erythritol kinase [Helicobacter cetorum MIT 99-5656]